MSAESLATIETNHLIDIQPGDLTTMRANVTELDAKYDECMGILSQNDPNHSNIILGNLTYQVFIDNANQVQAQT